MSIKRTITRAIIRGALSLISDEMFIKAVLKGRDFEDAQMRKTDYQAPEGYRYEQIIENQANLEIFRKKGNYASKVIYMLHGGAYTQSLKDSHINMMKAYVDYCSCDVYALDYRVAPKNPYPAALDDAVAGYKVLLNRGWKPEEIVVAGDSAGGGLAMALGLKLKDMGMKIPETFILSSPWVDLTPREYTKDQRKRDMVFGCNNVLDKCAAGYAGTYSFDEPYISPVYGDFEGFANVYLTYSKGELLSYAGKTFIDKLMNAGVNVVYEELDNGSHDIIATGAKSDAAKDAWQRIGNYMKSQNAKQYNIA